MRSILILAQKDFALFLKDKTAILFTFLVPAVVIYIVGNVFGGAGDGGSGLGSNIKLAVYNESTEQAAQAFVDGLVSEKSIDVITQAKGPENTTIPFTRESVRQGIEERHYNFALIIPADYKKQDGIGIRLEYLTNPKNQVESQMMNGLIQKAVYTKLPQLLAGQLDDMQRQQMGEQKYDQFLDGLAALITLTNEEIEYEAIRKDMGFTGLAKLLEGDGQSGSGAEGNSILQDIVTFDEDQVYGKEVKSPIITNMVGGYAIMFLLFSTTASAASLFEERNNGLFHRLFSMPVKRTHILWSKYVFNTTIGVVQAITLFAAANLLFGVEVWPYFLELTVVSIFASAACTAFGMLLASIAKTPQQAQGFGTLLIITMSALGGAWFPVSIMGSTMQLVAKFTLVHWGIQAYLGAIWEKANLLELLPQLGILAAITLALTAIASWRFKTGDLFS